MMNKGNLSQLLQQVIMGGTAPTTTITSDGSGNNKESTKIVWDGGGNVRDFTHNFRPESQGPSITASPTNEEFMQNPSANKFLPTVAGNMWDGVSGAMNDFATSRPVTAVTDTFDNVNSWLDANGSGASADDGYLNGDPGVDANGNPFDIHANPRYGPDGHMIHGSGVMGGGGRGALGKKIRHHKKMNPVDPADPHNILGGGTPPAPVDQAQLDAEKKAAIKEKFKNVKGGDYSVKAVEESAEQAGQEYQDDMLSRYGDYDFAVQAAETRKERLKRTNQVVMQGFMLDVMSQALGKKVGSQNYVENALKALETDFLIGNEDQLQEVTKALYFRPDGTYDPPASKDEAFQALTMMGLTTTEAATISGNVSESKEYYVQDKSNPSGYRVVREKPTGDTEYTTNATLANNKWGIDVNATSQTAKNKLDMEKKQLDIFQGLYPKVDGFFVNPEAMMNALSTHGSLTQDTVDNIDPKSLMQLHFMVTNPQFGLSKSNVVEVDASQLEEMDKNFAEGEYYVAIVTGLAGGEPQLKERLGSG